MRGKAVNPLAGALSKKASEGKLKFKPRFSFDEDFGGGDEAGFRKLEKKRLKDKHDQLKKHLDSWDHEEAGKQLHKEAKRELSRTKARLMEYEDDGDGDCE